MKRTLLLLALLSLVATSAHAVGADLSVVACPGDAEASANAGSLDCAGGGDVTLIMTFMPAEAIEDLAAVDMLLDLVQDGDLNTNAAFWNFETANSGAIAVHHEAPASGCSMYTDIWNESGAGAAWAAQVFSPYTLRMAALCYRPSTYSALQNQKLFGIQIVLDTAAAIEGGGGMPGCTRGACMVVQHVIPGSIAGTPTTTLTMPSVFGNAITFNGGSKAMCFAVPAVRHTWGQLKSLYR